MLVQHNVMMDQHFQNLQKLKVIQMFAVMKNQLKMPYIFMVMFKPLSQFIMILKLINQEFMNMFGDHTWVVTLLHLLVMVKKTVLSTGKSKTHGVLHGVKKVASELSEVLTNVVLKTHATKVITDCE